MRRCRHEKRLTKSTKATSKGVTIKGLVHVIEGSLVLFEHRLQSPVVGEWNLETVISQNEQRLVSETQPDDMLGLGTVSPTTNLPCRCVVQAGHLSFLDIFLGVVPGCTFPRLG